MSQARALVFLCGDAVRAATQDPPQRPSDSAAPTITAKHPPPCFRSDERYFCTRRCDWAKECKKLIAEWLR
ncbi:MAG: hypothetical protein N3A55_08375 [Methylohalobius sp.]|nr:hypothetical protein [Methylohalobius sp.]